VADFICQPYKVAQNKWHDWKALLLHGLIYTAVLTLGAVLFLGPIGIWYGLLNGVFHTVVDGVTSRLSHHYYAQGNIHMFWVVIGLDQLIHQIALIGSLGFFV